MWLEGRSMTTIEVRSLANEDLREIRIEEPINKTFKTWYDLFVKRTNKELTKNQH